MRRYLPLLICLFLFFVTNVATADVGERPICIDSVSIERSEEGPRLVASFHLDMPRGLEEALQRGVPLYFTTELQVYRPRWYWFDVMLINDSRTVRLTYNVLTRLYSVSIAGGLQQRVNSLEEALNFVRHPQHWLFDESGLLKENETYHVAVRFLLDISFLPKPFQIDVINDSTWRLHSEWKHFTF